MWSTTGRGSRRTRSERRSTSDELLDGLIAEARADRDTVGLILSGSRPVGAEDELSDYDVVWVLTDAAWDALDEPARHEKRAPTPSPDSQTNASAAVEIERLCSRELRAIVERPSWRTPDYATARVILDKTGQLGPLVESMRLMPEELAREEAERWLDAYLNAFYRSIKAWRRGDALGARLHAAGSVAYLVRALFAFERRWPQHPDRLKSQLALLEPQGWTPGSLEESFLRLLETGDPRLQQGLSRRVELLARERGHGQVIDAWGDSIPSVRAYRFE